MAPRHLRKVFLDCKIYKSLIYFLKRIACISKGQKKKKKKKKRKRKKKKKKKKRKKKKKKKDLQTQVFSWKLSKKREKGVPIVAQR